MKAPQRQRVYHTSHQAFMHYLPPYSWKGSGGRLDLSSRSFNLQTLSPS